MAMMAEEQHRWCNG